MSLKSERKRRIKAEKQAAAAAIESLSLLPCRIVKPVTDAEMVLWTRENNPSFWAEVFGRTVEHDDRHSAYHESGHAIMEVLFKGSLKIVHIIPHVPSASSGFDPTPTPEFSGGVWAGGECVPLDLDWKGLPEDERGAAVLDHLAITLSGGVTEEMLCGCKAAGDGQDRAEMADYWADVESGKAKDMRAAVVDFFRLPIVKPVLDAVAHELYKNKFLTGDQVLNFMFANGYDRDQWMNEFLRLLQELADGQKAVAA
jgi:hypothetical protein